MQLFTGVDLIEIERVRLSLERHGERFLQRVFTDQECQDCGQNVASLAARFAAKEAVSKALGTGIGDVAWQEIEIRRDARNAPYLHLRGMAEQLAQERGIRSWSLSLSHSQTHAIAMVVGLAE